jgi:fucose permease
VKAFIGPKAFSLGAQPLAASTSTAGGGTNDQGSGGGAMAMLTGSVDDMRVFLGTNALHDVQLSCDIVFDRWAAGNVVVISAFISSQDVNCVVGTVSCSAV